jgi:3'-phosphoadenosine 5'-phosphosulfate sulfotransferase (PAPS reductase)/FAD synthetase
VILIYEIKGTKENPRHICGISGGKDSSALVIHIKNNYPIIFNELELFFTDTGAELPEVYEYLDKMENYLKKKIIRLKADPSVSDKYRIVDNEDDSNPFEDILRQYNGYLPSPNARWCTRTMKLQPLERWIGSDYCVSYVGIRADENREGYNSSKSKNKNIESKFPFQDDDMSISDIYQILESTVGLPEYYKWRTRSGCFFCFYQRRVEWAILSIIYPQWFEASTKYEMEHADGRMFTWIKDKPLEYIKENAQEIIVRYIRKQYKKVRCKNDLTYNLDELIHMIYNNDLQKILNSWDMKRLHDIDGENKEGCTVCAI